MIENNSAKEIYIHFACSAANIAHIETCRSAITRT